MSDIIDRSHYFQKCQNFPLDKLSYLSETSDNMRKLERGQEMTRAVGYIRVSTEEQSREGISLGMQVAKIRAYCELNDLDVAGIYGDPGISGKTVKARPGIQAVLHLAKSKKIDAVVTYSLSRLARNTIQCLEMAQLMDKAGVALHSISEKLDTQSALGRFFFTLTASLAEMERALISERTVAALAQKRLNGEKIGGSVPYGYRVDVGRLIAEPKEQHAIRRIHQLRSKGYSYARIANALTKEGIFTRKGTAFRETQIVRILRAAA
jgi:site-specific DNA recombinase